MPYKDKDKQAAYMKRWREENPERWQELRKKSRKAYKERNLATNKPFVGCDGEGAGAEHHTYQLFRMGDKVIENPNGLTSVELMTFITRQPETAIYVGYAFDYDATMILRDLPRDKAQALFDRVTLASGRQFSRPVEWAGFRIEYRTRAHLRIKDVTTGAQRTIYDVFSLFQCSFLKALRLWEVGDVETLDAIEAGKARRGGAKLHKDDVAYNHKECVMLAELMTKVRQVCIDVDIVPFVWSGPGKVAAAAYRKHQVLTATNDGRIELASRKAYYGGRFELLRYGLLRGVWEYDIHSAYPSAMANLPCPLHGIWATPRSSGGYAEHELVLCRWDSSNPNIGPFPFRDKNGRLLFRNRGYGWIWSVELEAAERFGLNVQIERRLRYVQTCNCEQFGWVNDLYVQRQHVGSGTKGIVLKLILNSLYGKLAEYRHGKGAYTSFLLASIITARTRAKLLDATCLDHDDCMVMYATDAVYCLHELSTVNVSDRLGEWEAVHHSEMFTVQPGLYLADGKVKSRGIGRGAAHPKMIELMDNWLRRPDTGVDNRLAGLDTVSVDRVTFIGLRLALQRDYDKRGEWLKEQRIVSMSPLESQKRSFSEVDSTAESVGSGLLDGSYEASTEGYATKAYQNADMQEMIDDPHFAALLMGDN